MIFTQKSSRFSTEQCTSRSLSYRKELWLHWRTMASFV